MENVIEANRNRDLYLKDEYGNITYIPQGWCDDGPVDPEADENEPEIYAYTPITIGADSEVETMFVRISYMEQWEEVDQATARQLHPALFAKLERINAGLE